MSKRLSHTSPCKNVFQDGKATTSTLEYTRKWIELINILEKRKGTSWGKQQ